MEIENIATIDAAMALKGFVIYADRDDFEIEEGACFIADMIGLPVIDNDTGDVIGTLCDVLNLGASDIYTVKTENGEKMIPAVPEFIKKVDTENGIFVSLIEGMLD